MTGPKPRFLALTGPTASGKTDLSVALAEHLEGEIISMDSRQVYRGMDVATDKVAWAVRRRLPHHGLDLVLPDERYSAGQFARDVRLFVGDIESRGRIPLLVGGTGFFLRAVMDPIFAEPALDKERVGALRAYLRDQPRDRLARWVELLDPDRAALAIDGGPQRMSRAIEIALLSGRTLSRWHRTAPPEAEGLPGVVVLLWVPREEMDRRIDDRVAGMVERGLLPEVEGLLQRGYSLDDPGMSATGYREVVRYLRGECTLDDALDEIRRNTRRYARRQLTWFRNQLPDSTLRIDATSPLAQQLDQVLEAWRAGGGRAPTPALLREVGT